MPLGLYESCRLIIFCSVFTFTRYLPVFSCHSFQIGFTKARCYQNKLTKVRVEATNCLELQTGLVSDT